MLLDPSYDTNGYRFSQQGFISKVSSEIILSSPVMRIIDKKITWHDDQRPFVYSVNCQYHYLFGEKGEES